MFYWVGWLGGGGGGEVVVVVVVVLLCPSYSASDVTFAIYAMSTRKATVATKEYTSKRECKITGKDFKAEYLSSVMSHTHTRTRAHTHTHNNFGSSNVNILCPVSRYRLLDMQSVSKGRICSDNCTCCYTEICLQIKLVISPGHSKRTPGQPVLAQTS